LAFFIFKNFVLLVLPLVLTGGIIKKDRILLFTNEQVDPVATGMVPEKWPGFLVTPEPAMLFSP
jgi:hypothetical protein